MGNYFTPQPDIARQNEHLGSKKRSPLLLNGNLRNAIPLDGIYYLLLNTCPFDALVQILTTAGIDDPTYYAFITANSASSAGMKFIRQFVDTGVGLQLYKERTKLLTSLYQEKIIFNSKNAAEKLFANVFNMYGDTGDVWTTF